MGSEMCCKVTRHIVFAWTPQSQSWTSFFWVDCETVTVVDILFWGGQLQHRQPRPTIKRKGFKNAEQPW